VRVFVVEDHPVVREGLRRVLEHDGDISVSGSAQTLAEAALSIGESRPHVILCDLHLPDAEETEAVRRLAGRGAAVVVFTVDADADVVLGALRAGARGYLSKRAAPAELRAAVRAGEHAGPTAGL
jgi:DNA-binding NarL/FixJ family response regulator